MTGWNHGRMSGSRGPGPPADGEQNAHIEGWTEKPRGLELTPARSSLARASGRLSLRVKLVLTIVPLILLFMALNFAIILTHERDLVREETAERADSIASGLASAAREALSSNSDYLLQTHVDAMTHLQDVEKISIVDERSENHNAILADSDPARVGTVAEDLFTIQARTAPAMTQFDDPTHVLRVSHPIVVNTETGPVREATAVVVLDLTTMEQALKAPRQFLLVLTTALIVFAVVFMSLIAQWLVAPIQALVELARKLAAGDMNVQIVPRNDEAGVLAANFKQMAVNIESLRHKEAERRQALQQRVSELLAFTRKVSGGDLSGQAQVHDVDSMGRLVQGFNDMVRALHETMETERQVRRDLESSKQTLEEANEKLKELDKLKSEFLNTVSHELRTPLTSIKAFSEILTDNQGEDRQVQHEFLSIINQEADRLTRLINNLLDLSRIEANQMTWERGPVPIDTVVSAAVNATRALVDKKGLKLEQDVSAGLVVMGDQDKLIQVVTNLLSNAIKFTPQGGNIWVSAYSGSGEMALDVKDSGRGIAPEFHEKIFEKFQQVDTASSREAKGSGLGLPIVRSIVDAHGGRVWVESALGKGSTFKVRLPLHSPASSLKTDGVPVASARAEAAPVRRESRPAEQTVLVVDDEDNIRRPLRHILERDGYRVVEARTGEEGLAKAAAEHPDVILLDVRLPDIDGFQVLTRLRADAGLAPIPVILVSIMEARERGFQLGAQDYFPKPIDQGRLMEAVGRLVQKTSRQDVKILVVDDEPHIVQAVTNLLEARGYETVTAQDGLESVVRARDTHPDLIILDIYMPDMDGFEVIKQLRNRDDTCQIPIIILTASDLPVDELRAQSLGVAEYMNKPFSEKELARAVRDALRQVRRRKSDEEDSGS